MPVIGAPEDLALSGWDDAPDDGPVFALGGAQADAVDVRFAGTGDGRLIAPSGERLWRRAMWPVRDELFDLAPAAEDSAVLIVAPEAGRIADALDRHGTPSVSAARLTADGLAAAAVVVLIEDGPALPRHAACVLAARRVLVSRHGGVGFGLQSGVELLRAATADEAAERAHMVHRYPRSAASLRVMGARAAWGYRVSLVYPRLAGDL